MQWLRRSFITGFFVTVPLAISIAAFVWIFRLIDGFVGPFYDAWLQRMPQLGITHVPGLGILTTAWLAGRETSEQLERGRRVRSEAFLDLA